MTFRTDAEIRNVQYTSGKPGTIDEGFDTNISGWYGQCGGWVVEEGGLHGNNTAVGDRFALDQAHRIRTRPLCMRAR